MTSTDDAATPDSDQTVPARDQTALEKAIADGQAGSAEMNDVIAQFVNAPIVVPTATEVVDDMNQLQPVLFDREGTPMLATCTNVDRIPPEVIAVAQFAVEIPAAELVQAVPAETGLVVNPGNTEGFEMLPEGVQQLANDVRRMVESMEQQAQAEAQEAEARPSNAAPTKIDPSSIPNF